MRRARAERRQQPDERRRAAVQEQLELQVDDAGRPLGRGARSRAGSARRPIGKPRRTRIGTVGELGGIAVELGGDDLDVEAGGGEAVGEVGGVRRDAAVAAVAFAGRRVRGDEGDVRPHRHRSSEGPASVGASVGRLAAGARPTPARPASCGGGSTAAARSSASATRRAAALSFEPCWSIHTVGTSTTSKPSRSATTSRSTSNRKSRDDISGTTRSTTRRWITLAPHWVSAYGRWNSCRTPQAKPLDVSERPRRRAHGVNDAGRRRLAMTPSASPAQHRHAGQLGRRRRAVGVDEGDEVGVAAAERLHEHAALAELRELVEDDALVVGGVGPDDVGRVVVAPVEGDEEADVGLGEAAAVGPQRAGDAVLLVVGGDDDVQGHGAVPSIRGEMAGCGWGDGAISTDARRC